MGRLRQRGDLRWAIGVAMVAVAGLVLRLGAGVSLGGFSAQLAGSGNTATGGLLAYSNSYPSGSCGLAGSSGTTVRCGGTLAPEAVPATGSASVTDTITSTGTIPAGGVAEGVSAASCAPVKAADGPDSANSMLPRYGVAFSPAAGPMTGAGSVTLDGSSGYLSDVVSQTQPNPQAISLGATVGLGIWFKTATAGGPGGPLFEIGGSPTNTANGDDRVLYLNSSGELTFAQDTQSGGTVTTTSTSYNDGKWHFAYLTLSTVSVILGVAAYTTLYVDGGSGLTNGGLLGGLLSNYDTNTGYWHLGWAPTAVTGVGNYFAGSLSDFVVFDNPNAPSAPGAAQLASQSAFASWASSATDSWTLADTGTTTFAGTYPTIGTTSPCSMIDLGSSFAAPASCAVAPASTTTGCSSTSTLAAFATGAWQNVAAPAPGATQTSTITVSRDATYNGYVSGLQLYLPLSFRARTAPAAAWSVTFQWTPTVVA